MQEPNPPRSLPGHERQPPSIPFSEVFAALQQKTLYGQIGKVLLGEFRATGNKAK